MMIKRGNFILIDQYSPNHVIIPEITEDNDYLAHGIIDTIHCSMTVAERILANAKTYRAISIFGFGVVDMKIGGDYIIIIPNDRRSYSRWADDMLLDVHYQKCIFDCIFGQLDPDEISSSLKECIARYYITDDELTDDQKLTNIFRLYKTGVKNIAPQLFYALLAWQDNHKYDINRRRNTNDSRRKN